MIATREDLNEILANQVPEGKYIEFKRDLPDRVTVVRSRFSAPLPLSQTPKGEHFCTVWTRPTAYPAPCAASKFFLSTR